MKKIKRNHLLGILTFVVLLTFQSILVLIHHDSWPMSQYPMFSKPKTDSATSTLQIDFDLKSGATLTLPWKGDRLHTVIMKDFADSREQVVTPVVKKILEDYANTNSIDVSDISKVRLVRMNSKLGKNKEVIESRETIKVVSL